MFIPFFDSTMLIVLPGLLLAMYAQIKVHSTFSRYSQVRSQTGMTGAQAARQILNAQGLDDVPVEMIEGELSDHYDPRDKVLRLSRPVYSGSSVASLGVAAHEAGHAIQHATGYYPLNIRNSLVPVANFGSMLAFPLFLIGFLISPSLIRAGLWLFSAVIIFQVVTLPVEFNASNRAVALLEGHNFISGAEITGTKKVLSAAALTYVAAVLVSLLQLVRLLLISGLLGNRDE